MAGIPVRLTAGHGALAQLGERRLCKPEAIGSIPIRSTKSLRDERSEELDKKLGSQCS